MAEAIQWIGGIVATIFLALIGTIFLIGRQRDDKQDMRADKQDEKISEGQRALTSHAEANVRTHAQHGERLAKLEERSATHEKEIGKMRDMRHEINAETSRTIMDNYKDMLDRLILMREDIVKHFERKDR